jgi:hypothetical protein
MNLTHLHMLLNHVPTVGTGIALALLVLSYIRKNDALKRVTLEVFFIIALVTIPAYLSGVSAQQQIQERPDVSKIMINAHQDVALQAFLLMQLTGGIAWLALWKFRRIARWAPWAMAAVLVLGALTLAVSAGAATLGGEIRHPEILVNEEAAQREAAIEAAPSWVHAAGIGAWVTDRTYVWPASEALHFIGLWLIFGIILLVNLRMLGMMKAIPFSAMHRLLPWAALGFGINLITGMLFVTATPEQYAENISFLWKIGFLLVAGLNLLYVTVFEGPWHVEAGDNAPLRVKAAGASAIVAWIGVMYFGRMLPFIGNAF